MNPLSIITQGFLCSGTGGTGLPFPVPVTMITAKSIGISSAKSSQITTQAASTGISKQIPSSNIDTITGNEQL